MLDPRSGFARFMSERAWIPMAALVLLFFVLASITIRIDKAFDISPDEQIWLYGGSAESAISVLSAIASSSVTVAGVIFSATYVALQLASSQYTPRVVQSLARNRRLQLVLGTFLGTFCYSMMVLRSILPEGANGQEEFVPVISVSTSILLALMSIGMFIYFVWYGFTSIQPSALIDSAGSHTFKLIERASAAQIPAESRIASRAETKAETSTGEFLTCQRSGYLRHVDINGLYAIAQSGQIHIQIEVLIGSYVFEGEPLVEMFHIDSAGADTLGALVLDTIDIGDERTPDQDVDFGFRRVADIMIKALSPAINDPTTATYCFNKLCDLVLTLATTFHGAAGLCNEHGEIRVSWKEEEFDRCVRTAFEQLRYYAIKDSSIVAFMLKQFERLVLLLPENRKASVIDEASALRDAGLNAVENERDRQMIEDASGWLLIWRSQTSLQS